MSKNETRYCASVIREHFGNIVEKVATTLLHRGRLSVPQLHQYLTPNVTQKQVRDCLFILMHQRIVMYSDVTLPRGKSVTYYQVSIEEVMMRDRFPIWSKVACDTFGEMGKKITCVLLQHSRVTAAELKSFICPEATSLGSTELAKMITEMQEARFIMPANPQKDTQSTVDRKLAEFAAEQEKYPSLTAKEKDRIWKDIETKYEEERVGIFVTEDGANGKKRKIVEVDDMHNKRLALDIFENKTRYKLNFDRFMVQLRNEEISKLGESRISKGGGEVLRQIMKQGFKSMKGCKMDQISPPVTKIVLQSKLDPTLLSVAVGSGLPTYSLQNLEDYLEALSTDEARFVTKVDEKGGGQWAVNISLLCSRLRSRTIEGLVLERYGGDAARIYRLLQKRGKLDEKQIAKFAMMDGKTVREHLHRLLQDGLVHLQDVPKGTRSADHAVGKTIFLWFIHPVRSLDCLTQDLLNMLINLKEKRRQEVSKNSILLEKSERTDVVGRVDEMLSELELKELKELEAKLVQLIAAEMRIQLCLMILRDF
ncbi:hypothetical protein BJ742DRAFT_783835 [Cladochytrium replicatum]|nr:hypothetical protein BJ742DRAFT_783835 [Cladochytrium replicatum]